MASGRTHTICTLMVGAAGVSQLPISDAIPFGLGALTAIILQPDLDQIDGPYGYYGFFVLRETWPPLERFWSLYFKLYAKFPHRSIWTHGPFIGTVIRLLYTFWWLYFLLPNVPSGSEWFVTAIIACDIMHWILDWRIWQRFGLFKQKGKGE